MYDTIHTAADALNDALVDAGVTHVFVNSGTDYPPVIESWAKSEATGRAKPEIVIAPHETAAFHAAMGYAQVTNRAQAVFVHVDVGTQNIGGAIHNAFRCRVPVFVLAGLSPHTIEGELAGGRNAYIQFIQNTRDQHGVVRGYVKYDAEYRAAENVRQVTHRALQIANSEPRGPVYLTATRETLERESPQVDTADVRLWQPVAPYGLDGETVEQICRALIEAERPLIITSYLGRNENAVAELVKFAEKLAIPVIETNRANMNFPGSHVLHLGFDAHAYAENADVILVLDSDVPWIPAKTKPTARVFYVDIDPIKEDIPVWYVPSEVFARADTFVALKQLNARLEAVALDSNKIASRREKVARLHSETRADWAKSEAVNNVITPEYLTACVREIVTDDTIILNETISHHAIVDRLLPRNKPGTHFTSGGSSLGWFGGAAIGVKFAKPDADVVALCGDGTFIFSAPTAVYWMAARYNTPFLTVIYNNSGWGAPKQITTNEHPDGFAVQNGTFWTSFAPSAQLDKVAEAAGNAFARTVSDPAELFDVLREARDAVRGGRAAVVNVMLQAI